MSSGESEQPRVTETGPTEIGSTIVMPPGTPMERPRWLWPNRIPLGYLTLLAGEPQAGKSYLTLDIAARITRGDLWPGESVDMQGTDMQGSGVNKLGPGSALLVCLEDSCHDTILPRLVALGADLTKIRPLSFGEGLTADMRVEWLREKLREMNDCRLIVIDPITAFLNELGGTSGSQGRKLVYLLAECVHGRSIALVMVTHLRGGKGKAIHRPSGNDALVRAARAVWLLANDNSDPQRRLLMPIKNNLGVLPSGLTFKLAPVGNGQYARLQWEREPVLASADDSLRDNATHRSPPRDHILGKAVDWLKELLRDGRSVPAAEVHQLAKARGISYGTLRRAFCELGVESLRQPPDSEHPFLWQLNRPATAD